jgi:hypothetical protein
MKQCPCCAEDIQDAAVKCKHCGEFLNAAVRLPLAESAVKWYYRKSFIVIAVCCVGPLALPLLWWRPQTTRAWKIGLTVVILALSWVLWEATLASLRSLEETLRQLQAL